MVCACAAGVVCSARFLLEIEHPRMNGLPINYNAPVIVECGHGAVNGLCARGHGARLPHHLVHCRIPAGVVHEWVVGELVVDGLKGVELPG